jgi:hypothetical protein
LLFRILVEAMANAGPATEDKSSADHNPCVHINLAQILRPPEPLAPESRRQMGGAKFYQPKPLILLHWLWPGGLEIFSPRRQSTFD